LITRTSRGTKRFMATAAAVAMIGSTLAISSAASAGGANPGTPAAAKTDRVSGANRNATAVDAAVDLVGTGNLTNLTIVNGLDFPDGLAAAGLGGDPILLTTADAIPAETQAFLELRAAEGDAPDITIVGGTSVVSDKVAGQLNDLNGAGIVTRIPGVDRYATALAVGTANITANNGTNAILATGLRAADALSAGPLAIAAGDPIILNDGASLRADVRAWLGTNGITSVTIVGGTGAVPQSVEDELTNELGITVTRLAGANRDATSAKIAAFINASNLAQQPALAVIDSVVLVNRNGFADALAGGPLAETLGGAILTVGVNSLPAETAAFLAANCDAITTVTAIGGTAVISDEVLAAAAAATKCTVPGISSAALTITKTTQRVMYIADGTTVAADDTAPSLTSVAGSAASGSAAGDFEVEFKDAVGAPSVEINFTVFPVVITYTDNFTGVVTPAEFVATWNASVAKDLFKAAVGTVVTDFDTKPADTATPGGDDVVGSYDATLVVTFDQAVLGATATPTVTPLGVVNNNSSTVTTAVLLGTVGAGATTPTTVAATGTTTVTQTWTGQTTAVPTANATVRYAVATVSNLANGQANVALIMKTITVS
jgi:putative cell wall-binding protein